jgi:hypothetical protein
MTTVAAWPRLNRATRTPATVIRGTPFSGRGLGSERWRVVRPNRIAARVAAVRIGSTWADAIGRSSSDGVGQSWTATQSPQAQATRQQQAQAARWDVRIG